MSSATISAAKSSSLITTAAPIIQFVRDSPRRFGWDFRPVTALRKSRMPLGRSHPASSNEVSSAVIACIEELAGYWIVKETAKPLAAEPWSPKPHPTFLAPIIERYDDLKELLVLDPVHDTAVAGWPKKDGSVS